MKMGKIGIYMGILVMGLGFLAVLAVHAQPDFSMWNGKWFILKVKYKGYRFEVPPLTLSPNREVKHAYLHLGTWDRGTLIFPATDTFVRVFDDSSGWIDVPLTVNVHGGLEWDFLCWISEQNSPDISYAFTLRARGKEDPRNPGQLKTANLKSLGGCYWEQSGSKFYAGAMSLTGKMIDASQVPVP